MTRIWFLWLHKTKIWNCVSQWRKKLIVHNLLWVWYIRSENSWSTSIEKFKSAVITKREKRCSRNESGYGQTKIFLMGWLLKVRNFETDFYFCVMDSFSKKLQNYTNLTKQEDKNLTKMEQLSRIGRQRIIFCLNVIEKMLIKYGFRAFEWTWA